MSSLTSFHIALTGGIIYRRPNFFYPIPSLCPQNGTKPWLGSNDGFPPLSDEHSMCVVGRHKHWSTNDSEEVYGDSLETVGTLRSPKLAHEKLTCIGEAKRCDSEACQHCVQLVCVWRGRHRKWSTVRDSFLEITSNTLHHSHFSEQHRNIPMIRKHKKKF